MADPIQLAPGEVHVWLTTPESVRDPQHGGCGAVLAVEAFAAPEPTELQTWLLEVSRDRVTWTSASPLEEGRFEFRFS